MVRLLPCPVKSASFLFLYGDNLLKVVWLRLYYNPDLLSAYGTVVTRDANLNPYTTENVPRITKVLLLEQTIFILLALYCTHSTKSPC
jgi:hypothetical protein